MLPLMSSPNRMFGGNPVAVVFDADGLSESQMQAIAVEFNYLVTTFVLRASQPDHAAWVRIFTPSREIPFAGHPNVGTAFALAALMGERGETIPPGPFRIRRRSRSSPGLFDSGEWGGHRCRIVRAGTIIAP